MTPASASLQPTRDGFRLTVISAVYNVARYLPEFIASLEAQTFDHGRVQVIAVDDGSTDESGDLLRAWAQDTRYAVTVLAKENGGQSSARNLGLDAASGDWVTFADPDDMLDPEYFTQIHAFLAANPGAAMAATNLLDFHELTGETRNTHPLRHRFTGGDRLVDLDRHPNFFHMSGGTSVFPLRALQDLGLRFDLRVARPSRTRTSSSVSCWPAPTARSRTWRAPGTSTAGARTARRPCRPAAETRASTPTCWNTASWTCSSAPKPSPDPFPAGWTIATSTT